MMNIKEKSHCYCHELTLGLCDYCIPEEDDEDSNWLFGSFDDEEDEE